MNILFLIFREMGSGTGTNPPPRPDPLNFFIKIIPHFVPRGSESDGAAEMTIPTFWWYIQLLSFYAVPLSLSSIC